MWHALIQEQLCAHGQIWEAINKRDKVYTVVQNINTVAMIFEAPSPTPVHQYISSSFLFSASTFYSPSLSEFFFYL